MKEPITARIMTKDNVSFSIPMSSGSVSIEELRKEINLLKAEKTLSPLLIPMVCIGAIVFIPLAVGILIVRVVGILSGETIKSVAPDYQSQASSIKKLLDDCFEISELPETEGVVNLRNVLEEVEIKPDPTTAYKTYWNAIADLKEFEVEQLKIVPCGNSVWNQCDDLLRALIHSGAKIN